MWVKNEVVDVVELLVLVVEVELVVVVPAGGRGGRRGRRRADGSRARVLGRLRDYLLLDERVLALEAGVRESAGDTTKGSWLASATDCAVVATRACRRVLVVELAPPPPRQPASSTAHPATRSTPARRCRCRCNFIFSVR